MPLGCPRGNLVSWSDGAQLADKSGQTDDCKINSTQPSIGLLLQEIESFIFLATISLPDRQLYHAAGILARNCATILDDCAYLGQA